MLHVNALDEALQTLGEVLADADARVALAIIGGGALLLAGHIERPTKDVDVVAIVDDDELLTAEPLAPWLLEAVRDVANALELEHDWLNPGPTSVLRLGLPEGFLSRCERRTYGTMLLYIADRQDQIALKLYAAADHWPSRDNKHLEDLQRLAPTPQDLAWAARWARSHDASEGFEVMQLQPVLATLAGSDG